jgi:DNA-binding GntR family transcriptional regulator
VKEGPESAGYYQAQICAKIGANIISFPRTRQQDNQPEMGPQFQKLKRHLATEIAVAIRDGAYRSGEWLRQIDLEEKFNAKRFEVRAALAELTLRGTVAHVPNRGYCVAFPNIEHTRDLLAIRALLEVEAAKLAMPNIGRKQMREIKLLADAFEKSIIDGGMVEHSRTNAAFHDAIYQHAPNRKLVELVVEMRDRSIPWPITLWPSHSSLERSAMDHRAIMAALEARDSQRLTEAVQHHVIVSEPHYAHHSNDTAPAEDDNRRAAASTRSARRSR